MLSRFIKGIAKYFYVTGILFHGLMLIALIISVIVAVHTYNRYDLPPQVFLERASASLQSHKSPLFNILAKPVDYLATLISSEKVNSRYTFDLNNGLIGAHASVESRKSLLGQHKIYVESSEELLTAISDARAGEDIIIMPGEYRIKRGRIHLDADGEEYRPIRLRAQQFGSVKVLLDSFEGFLIKGNHWHLENLQVIGSCNNHRMCEHAVHIAGASGVEIRNNLLSNFNSIIKANGVGDSANRRYPDNAIIENNTLTNDSARKTISAVTHIDVVAGNNWQIRKNILLNNSKQGSDYTSYAAFIKGDAKSGVFEQNIVDCENSLPNDGSTRIGLSFGGGGTGENYCRDGLCEQEHSDGTMRNNLILNCSQDVGIYINKGFNTLIHNNTVLNSLGIDIRFTQSSARVLNNHIEGSVRSRDGARVEEDNNHIMHDFTDIQRHLSQYDTDLCGYNRNKFSPVGALTEKCLAQLKLQIENAK
ncbi:hypothetical protein [Thalassotalea fusca]